jgi:hypothetical protein
VTAVVGADGHAVVTSRREAAVPPSVAALARVETVRLLLHPAFVIGLLAGGLVVWQAIATDAGADWPGAGYYGANTGWFPLWVGTLVASALGAGRARFLDDPDLFPGAPMPERRRVEAAVLALVGPVAVSVIAVGIEAIAVSRAGGFRLADPPASNGLVVPAAAEWVQQPLLVLLAGVLGVVIARLPRGRAVVLLLVSAATFFGSMLSWAFGTMPLRALHPLFARAYEQPMGPSYDPAEWVAGNAPALPPDQYVTNWREVRFDDAALLWHLLGLAGLVLLGIGIAGRLAGRSGGARWWLVVGGAAAVIAIGAKLVVAGPT